MAAVMLCCFFSLGTVSMSATSSTSSPCSTDHRNNINSKNVLHASTAHIATDVWTAVRCHKSHHASHASDMQRCFIASHKSPKAV